MLAVFELKNGSSSRRTKEYYVRQEGMLGRVSRHSMYLHVGKEE